MIGRLCPEDAYKIAKEVDSKANDAVFISCTNFRTIEIIELLEKEIGKPVITSNQATMWHALRKLGISDNLHGYGMLFEHF
jgi:maleate cis-trans isomerase